MRILDVSDILAVIRSTGLKPLYLQLIDQLETDFRRWPDFHKSPRHSTHYQHGVIELMPCSDDQLYSFKYVNGHPDNTSSGKLCVAAVGLLADVKSGYPVMISEMTLLTAIRTAAVAALGAKYLARNNSEILAIIGNGAQSEFQAMAMLSIFKLKEIRVFDSDPLAMQKFKHNLRDEAVTITQCNSIDECISTADIIITATAAKKSVRLFTEDQIKPGTHIHAMGGDCPGKTELGTELITRCKLVVEYSEQSLLEGEIQQLNNESIHAELWEIITGTREGRTDDSELTMFDSVGFAVEDFSTLKLVYTLAEQLDAGNQIELVPELDNPKDLYGLLHSHRTSEKTPKQ